jgi:HD superfamily phosphohydrolase
VFNKQKIINDPVHGFISIPSGLHLKLIQHPDFQRLNRIKQLGLSYLVYPGAQHTRFQHSLGAMHLMNETISQLRLKGNSITDEEADAVLIAILLHDIGHAPFSHVLEDTVAKGISHEEISLLLIQKINKEMNGKLELALRIFQNTYHKNFLHQLVSSQLDMDRLDYLIRDSFFTGVVEGAVGTARIIKMLNVYDDQLVIEAKGIYSIEKFLIARRMMFWQVYFHKTSVAAERLLINLLRRAKDLAMKGERLFASPSFGYFLYNQIDRKIFYEEKEALDHYTSFDDSDIISAIKVWQSHDDKILSLLSKSLIERKLFKSEILEYPLSEDILNERRSLYVRKYGLAEKDADYLLSYNVVSANTYTPKEDNIKILFKNGEIKDIAEVSDILNISLLSKPSMKYHYCYLRND